MTGQHELLINDVNPVHSQS